MNGDPEASGAEGELATFVTMCGSVIDAPELGPDDALADVGATSISLIVLQAEIEARYGVDIRIDTLLAAPSVRAVWSAVRDARQQGGAGRGTGS